VELSVSIAVGSRVSAELKREYPNATTERGVFEVTIRGSSPSEVADAARTLLERVQVAAKGAKEFK
jgi:hypothetical protein